MRPGRLLLGIALTALAVLSYVGARERTQAAGEARHLDLAPDAEAALALRSAALRAAGHGGLILNDGDARPARDAPGSAPRDALDNPERAPSNPAPRHPLPGLAPSVSPPPTPAI